MSYKKAKSNIIKEVINYAYYVVQVAELITPETRKDLISSIQRESQTLYRNVMKH